MATPQHRDNDQKSWLARLLREPTLHFFAIAALGLTVQRLRAGDPRTIDVSPVLKADLLRRFQDQLSRPPTPAEAEAFMSAWKADEALYREALREGIDRDDQTVRNVLTAKMRDRLLLQTRVPEPSDAELQQYLEQHRADFEAPLIYEYDSVAFPKQPGAEALRAKAESRLAAGEAPASLGLRNAAANVNRERMDQDLGPEIAAQVAQLAPGAWHEFEASDRLLLVKLHGVTGGPPEPAVLHAQLVASWKAVAAQRGLEQATRALTARYHFEEKP